MLGLEDWKNGEGVFNKYPMFPLHIATVSLQSDIWPNLFLYSSSAAAACGCYCVYVYMAICIGNINQL